MPITLVNSKSFNTADQASDGSGNVALSTSGLTLAQDDYVIVAINAVPGADRNMTASGNNSGACTEIADLYSNDTRDTNLGVFYAKQGATTDTTITVSGFGVGELYAARLLQYRGVDTTTPLDVTTTTATGIDSDDSDPASITPTTSSAKIVIIYAGTDDTNINTWTAPSDVSNFVQIANDPSTATPAPKLATADKDWTSGAFDAAALTGGSTSASESWSAATFALRPAPSASSIIYDGLAYLRPLLAR